ncbi:ExeA family protein, partial [Insolitispirillum peregrinum]
MSYLSHFGLREHPFFLRPTLDHYFPTAHSVRLLQLLEQALLKDGGLLKLVGPVGSGKTLTTYMLIHKLLQKTPAPKLALLTAPQAQGRSLISMVCQAFGLPAVPAGTNPLEPLGTFLIAQQKAQRLSVLVIDEAQSLGLSGLEAVKVLSELENEDGRLLHVLLVGQTALDAMLAAKPMEKVREGISYSFNTAPLTQTEIDDYIANRLADSRLPGVTNPVFAPDAIPLLTNASGGFPALLNTLCAKSMQMACRLGTPEVLAMHVKAVIDGTTPAPKHTHQKHHSNRLAWAAGGLGTLIGAAVAGYVLLSPGPRTSFRAWTQSGPSIEQQQAVLNEQTRLAAEKAAADKAAAEQAEAARLIAEQEAAEKAAAEQLAAEKKAVAEKMAANKETVERLMAEKIAAKLAADKAAAEKKAAEKAAAEKLAAEKAATEKIAAEKAAAEKLAAEKAAAEKLAAEKAAAEKLAAEKAAAEKLAAEKAAAEKLAAEKAAAEKLAAEKAAAEKLAAEKAAAEKLAAEKAAAEKLAAEKAAAQKLAAEKAAAEKLAAEKAATEKLAAEKAAAEKLAAEKAATEKLAAEKAAAEKLAAEKAATEKLAAEKAA